MHVHDTGLQLVHGHQAVFLLHLPYRLVGRRIPRHCLQISRRNEISERLGRFSLVERLLVDHRTQSEQVILQLLALGSNSSFAFPLAIFQDHDGEAQNANDRCASRDKPLLAM